MLKAYFDESGIHDGSPICVVSGFVLSSKRAYYLFTDWHNLLFRHHLEVFHAKEFAARSGPFRGWSDAKVRSFSVDAVSTINGAFGFSEVALVSVAIRSQDFHALTLDERRWLTGGQFTIPHNGTARKWRQQGAPTKPYFLLFQQAVLDAVKFSQDTNFAGQFTGKGDSVHFCFDRQDEYEKTAKAVFGAMKQMPLSVKARIGDVVFNSKLKAVSLQVADFMAYESFVYLRGRELRGEGDLSEHALRLLERRGARSVFIDKSVLARLLARCPLKPKSRFMLPDP